MELGEVEFAIPDSKPAPVKRKNAKHPVTHRLRRSCDFKLVVKPFAVPLGAASPATASAEFDMTNYNFTCPELPNWAVC